VTRSCSTHRHKVGSELVELIKGNYSVSIVDCQRDGNLLLLCNTCTEDECD
jgi:hypothetical protein